MGVIAKYKFNNTLADLLPEFNSEFTSDLYTVTDEVDGEVTTRTIESDSLPTLMRFGRIWVEGESATDNRTDSLLEVLDMNTSGLTDFHSMFRYCTNLTNITCNWNTSKVINMQSVFARCNNLTSLDVSNWDTSKVTTMYGTFYGCSNLTSLDVSNFDTSNVDSMHEMFSNCNKLTSLDVSNWDTSKVTDMSNMFQNCSNLTSLDVSNFDTGKVTKMNSIFLGCSSLTELDVSGFDTSKVTDIWSMFYNCNSLTSLDLRGFDTSKFISTNAMFYGCRSLTSLDVSGFDTGNVTNMGNMFRNCSSLTSLDVNGFNTSKVTEMSYMFQGCIGLTSLDVSVFDTAKVSGMINMFRDCSKLTSLDVSKFDTTNVTNMLGMFCNCFNLASLDISGFDTGNVTDMNDIFRGCNTLKYLKCNNASTLNTLNTLLPTRTSDTQGTIICKSDITNLDTTTLQSKYWNILDEPTLITKYVFDKSIHNNCIPEFNTEFEGYFIEDEVVEGSNEVTRTIESCGMLPALMRFGTSSDSDNRSLSFLKILYINAVELTTMYAMFRRCRNLISVHNVDKVTNKVLNMWAMFADCNNLEYVDVSNWDVAKVNNLNYGFSNCYKLANIDVSKWDTSNITTTYYLFYSCRELTKLDLSNWNINNILNMGYMFASSTKLEMLDISNFDMTNVTDTIDMFYNTPKLTDIGMLNCNSSIIQKIVDLLPTDTNRTIWYKEANVKGITAPNHVKLREYKEENVEIVLNNPLLEGDTIEVVDDKICHVHRWEKVVLNGGEDDYRIWGSKPAENHSAFILKDTREKICKGIYTTIVGADNHHYLADYICDNFVKDSMDIAGYHMTFYNNFHFSLPTNQLNENTVEGFKQWLSENPTTVVYPLASPYYEDITPLQSSLALRTFKECNIQIITALPIKTKITYRTNITSAIVMEQELDTIDSGVSLSNLIEEEVDE